MAGPIADVHPLLHFVRIDEHGEEGEDGKDMLVAVIVK